jgi:hypothetical protein
MMHRHLLSTNLLSAVVFVAALALIALEPSTAGAQDRPDKGVLHINGDATALEIDVHQATLAEVMTALGRFNLRYRSPVELNDVVSGTYAGSLGRVLSRVLAAYNYAIKKDGAIVDVIVVGRRGEQASAAPLIIPIRRRPSD